MIRVLPFAIELVLLVWCLIEAISTPRELVRNLDKTIWIILIVLLPLVGSIAWLVAGRPQRQASSGSQWRMGSGFPEDSRPRRGTGAPDDDPDFLRSIASVNAEQEQTLSAWEADLKAREEQLRREPGTTGPADGAAEATGESGERPEPRP